jgi:hypothetical protein
MFDIENEKLSKIWNNEAITTKVERKLAKNLSPRAQEWFAWEDAHKFVHLTPTQKPLHNHNKVNPAIKKFDKEMNEKFEKRRLETPPELRISTNL